MTARPSRLQRQIDWARAEAERQRRLARRHAADARLGPRARRLAALAQGAAEVLAELAARPAPAAGRNRLNLWMAEPTPQQRAAENADLNQGDAAQDESTQEEAA
ncbi:hypothetical protein GCM10010203_55820 [Actinomadura yumaensis]